MHILKTAVDIVLAGYVSWEVARFLPQYRQLKQAVANGDQGARMRVYVRALAFEWISALLALVALGFDWNKLNPKFLDLGGLKLMQAFSRNGEFAGGVMSGMLIGVVLGTVAFIVARILRNRRTPELEERTPWWRKFLPDFSALLPVTTGERLFWAVVAVSAGICEEIVFRGWLLATLRGQIGLGGTKLIIISAAIFGLAHAYQGVSGIILTALAGAVFCVLYVETGSLLVPILLHSLVDLRFAILPAPRVVKSHTRLAEGSL
jgi:uncharacterized protein